MPSAEEHRERVDHHLDFLATIDTDEFADWAAVVAFYAGVHLVELFRALVGENSNGHGDRLDWVRIHHPAIHPHYHRLFSDSLALRYEAGPFHWLVPGHAQGQLDEIQRYVRDYVPPA